VSGEQLGGFAAARAESLRLSVARSYFFEAQPQRHSLGNIFDYRKARGFPHEAAAEPRFSSTTLLYGALDRQTCGAQASARWDRWASDLSGAFLGLTPKLQ